MERKQRGDKAALPKIPGHYSKDKKQSMSLHSQLGLTTDFTWLRDTHFWFFAGLGGLFLALVQIALPDLLGSQYKDYGAAFIVSFVLWQPLIEELLFRGLLQGLLLKSQSGSRQFCGITLANLICTIIFVVTHLVHQPWLWALAVFLPSLIFGYVRDRNNCVYPAVTLHVLFNAGFLVASLY